jgi:hypothetical protein
MLPLIGGGKLRHGKATVYDVNGRNQKVSMFLSRRRLEFGQGSSTGPAADGSEPVPPA